MLLETLVFDRSKMSAVDAVIQGHSDLAVKQQPINLLQK